MYNNKFNEIKRLKFENFIWIVFIILALLNINGDNNEIDFLESNNNSYKERANTIFETTLTVTLLIYIYFFIRNYYALLNANLKSKNLYKIKLLGSGLLIVGVILLLYFQKKQKSFTGSPAI